MDLEIRKSKIKEVLGDDYAHYEALLKLGRALYFHLYESEYWLVGDMVETSYNLFKNNYLPVLLQEVYETEKGRANAFLIDGFNNYLEDDKTHEELYHCVIGSLSYYSQASIF